MVALELIQATQRLLTDLGDPETPGQALGLPSHLLEDIMAGHILINMEDVTHWIAHFARRNYPSLHGYVKSDAAGRVVSSLELLIRAG